MITLQEKQETIETLLDQFFINFKNLRDTIDGYQQITKKVNIFYEDLKKLFFSFKNKNSGIITKEIKNEL